MTDRERWAWYGIYQWGMLPSECSHHPLSEAEFVQLMVDTWGGSWQNLYQKLSRQGWGLIKV